MEGARLETEAEREGEKQKGEGEPSLLVGGVQWPHLGLGEGWVHSDMLGRKPLGTIPPHSHVHTWGTSSCTGFKEI